MHIQVIKTIPVKTAVWFTDQQPRQHLQRCQRLGARVDLVRSPWLFLWPRLVSRGGRRTKDPPQSLVRTVRNLDVTASGEKGSKGGL